MIITSFKETLNTSEPGIKEIKYLELTKKILEYIVPPKLHSHEDLPDSLRVILSSKLEELIELLNSDSDVKTEIRNWLIGLDSISKH